VRFSHRLLLVGLGILAGVGVLTTSALAQAQPSNSLLYQAVTAKAAPSLPKVVARIGNQNLTADGFSRMEGMVRYSNSQRKLGMSEAQIRKAALNRFVRLASLQQRAVTEGITVSDSEVSAWISDQAAQRSALFQHDKQALADFNAMIAALGAANASAYDRDPRTIAEVRKLLSMGKLTVRHLGSNPSLDQIENYIQQVIGQTKVELFISAS
jgi:SurA N-terminal domain